MIVVFPGQSVNSPDELTPPPMIWLWFLSHFFEHNHRRNYVRTDELNRNYSNRPSYRISGGYVEAIRQKGVGDMRD